MTLKPPLDASCYHAVSPGAFVCSFLIDAARRHAGPRWSQGRRRPPLPCDSEERDVRLLAETRLFKVNAAASQAAIAWADHRRPADLLFHVPTPAYVLSLQARGRRCVSLLPAGVDTGEQPDELAFAVHDLCHLEKFVDPEHYAGQVGFFRLVEGALSDRRWQAYAAGFDPHWIDDQSHVIADMNGSSIFLFAALKMKLKMAVRRRLALTTGNLPPPHGVLRPEEQTAFDEAMDLLGDVLQLPPAVQEAARLVSTKHDHPAEAQRLLKHFDAGGRA